jgi:hypothetical protein
MLTHSSDGPAGIVKAFVVQMVVVAYINANSLLIIDGEVNVGSTSGESKVEIGGGTEVAGELDTVVRVETCVGVDGSKFGNDWGGEGNREEREYEGKGHNCKREGFICVVVVLVNSGTR